MATDRYDTSNDIEAQFESGSNNAVLKNLLGITSASVMDEVELDLLDQLYEEIPQQVEYDQQLTVADICQWHRRWLGNVYAWAGQYRSVNMGKADFQFAAAAQIERLMSVFDEQILSRYTPCNTMNDEQLAEAIAVVHIELILIHPFREGNGRLSRLVANIMAMQAGKAELDFSVWDGAREKYFAAIQAGLDNYQPMVNLVRQVLRAASEPVDE